MICLSFKGSRFAVEKDSNEYRYHDITNHDDRGIAALKKTDLEPDLVLRLEADLISIKLKDYNQLVINVIPSGYSITHFVDQCNYEAHTKEVEKVDYSVLTSSTKDLRSILTAFLQHYVHPCIAKEVYQSITSFMERL